MNNRNIIKKNQYKGLKNLQRTLDNFFNDMWWPTETSEMWEEFQPRSETWENKDNFYIKVDLPGIKKDKVEITREDNILKVRGERKEERKLEETKSHYSEVFYGTFTREFILPANADKEKEIQAHYEDGVLLITVPKSAKSKAQTIKIE